MNKILKLTVLSLLTMAMISCQNPSNGTNPSATPFPDTSSSPGTIASPNPVGAANPTDPSALTFSYIGLDADKVSQGANVVPDKANDLHFTANYTFPVESEVGLIIISRIENGKAKQAIGWITGTAMYWVLAAEVTGKILNPVKSTSLGKFSGAVKFDFYASDSASYGLTKPGTSYQLEINYKDASGQSRIITKNTTL